MGIIPLAYLQIHMYALVHRVSSEAFQRPYTFIIPNSQNPFIDYDVPIATLFVRTLKESPSRSDNVMNDVEKISTTI